MCYTGRVANLVVRQHSKASSTREVKRQTVQPFQSSLHKYVYTVNRFRIGGNCESRNAGTRNGTRKGSKMQSAPEISLGERSSAHNCEGAHGYSRDRHVYLLAV